MKIQINTTEKTIKVDETVSLKELTDELERFLPNGEWKEYKLDVTPVIITTPYVPYIPPTYPHPDWYWQNPYPTIGTPIICTTKTNTNV